MITPAEYIQLKAFARIDGAWLALVWLASFGCSIAGLMDPLLGMVSLALAVMSPFFVARRLRVYRDTVKQGVLSFKRGWAFALLVFFYGSVLLAVAQYVYFAFLDKGFMVQMLSQALASPQTAQIMAQSGMNELLSMSVQQMQSMRPIDISLQFLTTNIFLGVVLSLPIALVMRSSVEIINPEK